MDSKSKEQPPREQKPSGRSIKKNLAIAALTASLGLSLGVPVCDVFAAGNKANNQFWWDQNKTKGSSQVKIKQSSQIKDRQSSQMKGSQKQSSQMKGRKVETKPTKTKK